MTPPRTDLAGALTDLLEAGRRAIFEDLPRLPDTAAFRAGLGHAALFVAALQEEVPREVTGRGPDDRLLLHTDGITEARDGNGERFGIERFTDFVIRHHADGLPVAETLRRLVHTVLASHRGRLDDDATVLFCRWNGHPTSTH